MILRSIQVSGWRCFLEDVQLGPFSDGLNVIHASNGAGKSTLFEALCRVLLDHHSVGGQDIRAIQPWGRSLSPRVTTEFCHAGTEYRITKQFLEGSYSKLERKENGSYRPLADNRRADETVREMLTRNPPARGLSKPGNWGLAQALWAPQGDLALDELSGDVIEDIKTALGVQVSGAAAGPIEKRVEEIYSQYFTPTGRLKEGANAPELVRMGERLAEVNEEKRKAWETLLTFEETSRNVEELRATRDQARQRAEELQKHVNDIRGRAMEYRSIKSEVATTREAVTAAKACYEQLKHKFEQIKSAEKELAEVRETVKTLEEDAPLKRREVEQRDTEASQAQAALEDAQKESATVEQTARQSNLARQYIDGSKHLDELTKRLDRISEAQHRLDEAQKARTELVAPDDKTLKALRKAVKTRDDARTHIEASLITLEIVPEHSAAVEVIKGEHLETRELAAGETARVQGSPEVVADLKGVARLRASGPAGDIEEHRNAFRKAEKRIHQLTEPYGASDMDALETLREKARHLENTAHQVETERNTLLGEETMEDLRQEQAAQEVSLHRILEEYPDWRESPPDPEALETRASELKRRQDERVTQAETNRQAAQNALAEARERENSHQTRLAEVRKQASKIADTLTALTEDGQDFKEREQQLDELLMKWEAAKKKLEQLEARMGAFDDDPEATLEKLDLQLSAAREDAEKARDKEKTMEGRLETLAAKGPYTVLAETEEETTRLAEEVRREQLRADAIKLLRDTIEECRNEAVATVKQPVEETATRILQRIAGRRMGGVQLRDAFAPSAVKPEAVEDGVGIDNLSGGEKEQLHFATRMALAEALGREERQLVVLDDVLTATDAGRHARILTILEEESQHLQILVLTCHPERYRGLTDAPFFDLEAQLTA